MSKSRKLVGYGPMVSDNVKSLLHILGFTTEKLIHPNFLSTYSVFVKYRVKDRWNDRIEMTIYGS